MVVWCQQRHHIAVDLLVHMHFPAPAFREPMNFSSGRSSATAVLLGEKVRLDVQDELY